MSAELQIGANCPLRSAVETRQSADAEAPLLQMEQIEVSIGDIRVVKGASISVHRGETVGLVGESGSGKSMLCRAAVGLLGGIGGRISQGTVTFDGAEIDTAHAHSWRGIRGHRIGLVPQASLAGLDPIMRIGRQLRRTIRRLDPASDPAERSLELLESVQINDPTQVLRAYPHELSGGMRQRVMIALALAGKPDLMVADEATTALDATVQKSVLNLIRSIQRETGMALLMVTHDLSIVRQLADQISVMREGEIVESGDTGALIANPTHPYTKELLEADPSQPGRGRR